MSTLLPAECAEGEVLQAGDLGLQEPQVDDGRAAVVLPLDLVHPRALDPEDRHPPAADPEDLDLAQLAATHEAKGRDKQILGLEHRRLPQSHRSWTRGGELS